MKIDSGDTRSGESTWEEKIQDLATFEIGVR
jgi:hypothetical protein